MHAANRAGLAQTFPPAVVLVDHLTVAVDDDRKPMERRLIAFELD
jgi:hypothetical protein